MAPKFMGIPNFVTANFGQSWMGMSNPAAEQKATVPCPPSITQSLNQPEAYSQMLQQKTGILKVEIINNEVIAAGALIQNPTVIVLVHCRVTPAQLEFTVRSASPETTQATLADLQLGIV